MAAPGAVRATAIAREEVRKSIERMDFHLNRGPAGARGVEREVKFLDALHRQTARMGGRAVGRGVEVVPHRSFGSDALESLVTDDDQTIGRTKSSLLADFSADGLAAPRLLAERREIWVWVANASACPSCLGKHGGHFTGPFFPTHPSCMCIPDELDTEGVRPLTDQELVDMHRKYGSDRYSKVIDELEQGVKSRIQATNVENVNRSRKGAQAVAEHDLSNVVIPRRVGREAERLASELAEELQKQKDRVELLRGAKDQLERHKEDEDREVPLAERLQQAQLGFISFQLGRRSLRRFLKGTPPTPDIDVLRADTGAEVADALEAVRHDIPSLKNRFYSPTMRRKMKLRREFIVGKLQQSGGTVDLTLDHRLSRLDARGVKAMADKQIALIADAERIVSEALGPFRRAYARVSEKIKGLTIMSNQPRYGGAWTEGTGQLEIAVQYPNIAGHDEWAEAFSRYNSDVVGKIRGIDNRRKAIIKWHRDNPEPAAWYGPGPDEVAGTVLHELTHAFSKIETDIPGPSFTAADLENMTDSQMADFLQTNDWVSLTANRQGLDAAFVNVMNKDLLKDIKARGGSVIPATGHFVNENGFLVEEESFFVTGMNYKDASSLANFYEQEAVITRYGLAGTSDFAYPRRGYYNPAVGVQVGDSVDPHANTQLSTGHKFSILIDDSRQHTIPDTELQEEIVESGIFQHIQDLWDEGRGDESMWYAASNPSEAVAETVRMYFLGDAVGAQAAPVTNRSAEQWRADNPRIVDWVETNVIPRLNELGDITDE